MSKRIFTKDFLRKELDLPYGGDVVMDEIFDTSRWSEHHDWCLNMKVNSMRLNIPKV